jgi:ethanolamine utilization protein EutN
LTPEGAETGVALLALDAVDAGIGDTVLVVQEGWSASTVATGKAGAAIDSAIVGVVDRIDLLADEAKGGGA